MLLMNQFTLSTPHKPRVQVAVCLPHFKWEICSSERNGPPVYLGLPIPTMGGR